jgi:hypothetical protein
MKINEKENIVRFVVPKHNNFDRSEVLNEFNLVSKQINVLCILYVCKAYRAMIFYRT